MTPRRASRVTEALIFGSSLVLVVAGCNAFDQPPQRSGDAPSPSPTVRPLPATPPTATVPTLVPSPICGALQDLDGDGVWGVDRTGCDVSSPWPLDNSLADCDDLDATRHALVGYGLDSDGDGYGGPAVDWLCEGTQSPGLSADTTDCDDNDRYAHAYLYVDADGDGRGATATVPVCKSDGSKGFAPSPTDCDDSDPAVYVGADPELAHDGVDTDCDGYDLPWIEVGDLSEVATFTGPPWCEGAVLAVTAFVVPGGASVDVVLQVTNVGTAPVASASLVVDQIGAGNTSIATSRSGIPELAPGGDFFYHIRAPGVYEASIRYDFDTSSEATASSSSEAASNDGGAYTVEAGVPEALTHGQPSGETSGSPSTTESAERLTASETSAAPDAGVDSLPAASDRRCDVLDVPVTLVIESRPDPIPL